MIWVLSGTELALPSPHAAYLGMHVKREVQPNGGGLWAES